MWQDRLKFLGLFAEVSMCVLSSGLLSKLMGPLVHLSRNISQWENLYILISASVIFSEAGASQGAHSRFVVGIGLRCWHTAGRGEETGAHTVLLTLCTA